MALLYGQGGQIPDVPIGRFEWDDSKAAENLARHGLSFPEATAVFLDPRRIVAVDEAHSDVEPRNFCIGALADGSVATVRFTLRGERIRMIGAGRWRKGRKLYEEVHKT